MAGEASTLTASGLCSQSHRTWYRAPLSCCPPVWQLQDFPACPPGVGLVGEGLGAPHTRSPCPACCCRRTRACSILSFCLKCSTQRGAGSVLQCWLLPSLVPPVAASSQGQTGLPAHRTHESFIQSCEAAGDVGEELQHLPLPLQKPGDTNSCSGTDVLVLVAQLHGPAPHPRQPAAPAVPLAPGIAATLATPGCRQPRAPASSCPPEVLLGQGRNSYHRCPAAPVSGSEKGIISAATT